MTRLEFALLRTDLFGALSQAAFEAMVDRLVITPVAAGAWVVREGDPADAVYVVVSGRLEVVVRAPTGDVVRLAEVGPRDHFGEQAWLRGGAPRSAGVRAVEQSEVVRIGYAHLEAALAEAPALTASLRALGERQREEALSHRTDLVRRLLASVDTRPVERTLHGGAHLYRVGEPADRVYVILSGAVDLIEARADAQVVVGRVGPGLCVGDRDATHRTQTAVSVGPTRVLEVSCGRLADLARSSREARDHLAVMQRAWTLPQRGLVTQHLGAIDGRPCLTQIFHLTDGERFVASHLIGAEGVRLRAVRGQAARTVETPAGEIQVGLAADGRIVSVESASSAAVLPALFGRAIEGRALSPAEEARLASSGALDLPTSDFACECMRVDWSRVRAAIARGHTSLTALQNHTGAATACGACAPPLLEALGTDSFVPVRVTRRAVIGDDVVRIGFEPVDDRPLRPGRPGQHVVLRAVVDGERLARPYTLSGAAGAGHEVTARREGRFSGWLRTVEPGALLEASHPRGEWIWDGGPAPVICLMSGIGVTPGLCFARTLLREGWPHALVVDWSTRVEADRALVADLVEARAPNLTVRVRVTAREARIGRGDLQAYARRFPTARYFLCGGRGYMDAMEAGLLAAGVTAAQISRESFEVGG